MNTRQKKKQYKKRYGHNPPKGADGRYLFHVTYGLDLAAGQDHSGTLTPEQVEALTKIQALTPEDAERIRKSLCEAAAIAAQALADFAAAISQGFSNMADMLRGQIEEQEEPPVVVARHLAERRRKCRKEWKASKR
jgi:hypothetical protein